MTGRRPRKYPLVLLVSSASICLSGCNLLASWDRAYNLRQWEKTRLAAQSAYFDHDYARAEAQWRSSVAFARCLGSSDFRLGATLALLGNVLGQQGKRGEERSVYEMAFSSLKESLSLAHTASDRRLIEEDIAAVALSLGDLCLKTGDLTPAQQYYEQATRLYSKWQRPDGSPILAENLGSALLGTGAVAIRQGNSGRAAQAYTAAFEAVGAPQYSQALARQLKQLYEDSKRAGASDNGTAPVKAVERQTSGLQK